MYKNILLATDLVRTGDNVAQKAMQLARLCGARLAIVYVIEPISTFGFPLVVDIGTEGVKHAKDALQQLGRELSVAPGDLYVRTGSPKKEVLQLAEELSADLIVVGDQGRFGLSQVLGSTAMGVLHGCRCDVVLMKRDTGIPE